MKSTVWYGSLLGIATLMPEEDKQALKEWEAEHLGNGKMATSDWPGWRKYIGPAPLESLPPPYTKRILPRTLRAAVIARDGYKCAHCGSMEDLSIDHIKSERLGGTDDLGNLQSLCRSCNRRKGWKT